MRKRSIWGWGMMGAILAGLATSPVAGQAQGMKNNGTVKIANTGEDYGVIIPDNSDYPQTGKKRLEIQAAYGKSVAITNNLSSGGSGLGARTGIVVDEYGKVGVGNTDDIMLVLGYLQSGSVSPTVLGQNFLGFNAYYDNAPSGGWRYIGGSNAGNVGTVFPAGVALTDMTRGRMYVGVADAGNVGAAVPFKGLAISSRGVLGVGLDTYEMPTTGTMPQVRLDVKGATLFRDINNLSFTAGYIYGESGHLKARDSNGNVSTISPHDDPREQFPTAQTSFGDSAITLPFSFHHENEFIGKGSYVDMAKMVAYVQKKMQGELGQTAGQLVFDYDLPAGKRRTAEDYEVDAVLTQLQQLAPIKVTLGANGALPAAAMEVADESVQEVREVEVDERKLDLEAGRVVTQKIKKKIVELKRTGRRARRLKAGWSFVDGELYRPPTLNDLDVVAIARSHPKLPKWVLDRMQGGQAGQSVSSLVEEIKKNLSAARTGGKSPADLAANTPAADNR